MGRGKEYNVPPRAVEDQYVETKIPVSQLSRADPIGGWIHDSDANMRFDIALHSSECASALGEPSRRNPNDACQVHATDLTEYNPCPDQIIGGEGEEGKHV